MYMYMCVLTVFMCCYPIGAVPSLMTILFGTLVRTAISDTTHFAITNPVHYFLICTLNAVK